MTWITSAQLTERRKARKPLHKPCKCGENDAAKFSPHNWNRCRACTAEAQRRSRVNTGKRGMTMIG